MATKNLYIVFDAPPSSPCCRFVEVDDDKGRSVRLGRWIQCKDDLWAIEFGEEDLPWYCNAEIGAGDRLSMEDMEEVKGQIGETGNAVVRILDDESPIRMIEWSDRFESHTVGMCGVTQIRAYAEPGQYAMVPYFAVYGADDQIVARVPASHVTVYYYIGGE